MGAGKPTSRKAVASQVVDFLRNGLHVPRMPTRRGLAEMIKNQPLGDWLTVELVPKAMAKLKPSVDENSGVASLAEGGIGADPAWRWKHSGGENGVGPETLNRRGQCQNAFFGSIAE